MKVLLVHGAWHKGNCWDRLVPELEKKGIETACVTLKGHGEDRSNYYGVTFDDYIEGVHRAAEKLGSPCVLLGHSMGGGIISTAAELRPELFSRLIYLAAFVPGKSPQRLSALSSQFGNPELNKAAEFSLLRGCASPRIDSAIDLFYNAYSGDARACAGDLLCKQPLRPVLGKVSWSDDRLGKIPKHYFECTEDKAIPIESQRTMQNIMKFESVVSLASDHSPFLCMPTELAERITEVCV